MTRTVDLIIPDSGPLISLAHARRLDLVLVFDRPVVIADIVQLECLKKPGSPDHDVLAGWFARMGNRIRIEDTGMRGVYEAALERERSGEEPRATSGYGDAALAYMLRRIDMIAGAETIPLVLLEDSRAAKSLQRFGRAHVLSTRTWLNSLERAGVIPSADRIIGEMKSAGRDLSAVQVDRPAQDDELRSDWLRHIANKGRGIADEGSDGDHRRTKP